MNRQTWMLAGCCLLGVSAGTISAQQANGPSPALQNEYKGQWIKVNGQWVPAQQPVAGQAAAVTQTSFRKGIAAPCQNCPPESTVVPNQPSQTQTPAPKSSTEPAAPSAPAAAPEPAEAQNPIAALGGVWNGYTGGNLTAAGSGPTSATAASGATGTVTGGAAGSQSVFLGFQVNQAARVVTTAGANGTTFTPDAASPSTVQSKPLPLILPGLLTAINPESARPMDRVFFGYGYDDKFKATGGTGFNLNRFDIGVEKTFLEGRASAYIRLPFLAATENTTGQALDGVGDISTGLKFVLFTNCNTGSTLSAGMTVSVPTGRNLVATTNTFRFVGNSSVPTLAGTGVSLPGTSSPNDPNVSTITTTINPTYLQPYVSGILVFDRLFVANYFAVIVPTDDRVSTFLNNDFSLGYQIYRNQGGCLSFLTPTIDLQALVPVTHSGTTTATSNTTITSAGASVPVPTTGLNAQNVTTSLPVQPFSGINSPTQLFLSPGLQVGIKDRTALSTSVIVPIVGPKAFSVGFTVGLNYLY